MRLHALKLQIADVLANEIEGIVGRGGHYELTLLARHKSNDDAHILVTAEKDLDLIIEAVQKLKGRPAQ